MTNPRAAQLVEAGMWLRLSGDHEGAKRLFDQALKLDPQNERARQLLDEPTAPAAAPPPPPPQPKAPVAERSNPFAPPPTSTVMDLDWGSATGFAPTPVPFIPPVELRPAAVPKANEELELPVELDIEAVPPPVFPADPPPPSTLVFGLGGNLQEVPPPAPTVPEHWVAEPSSPTMLFSQSQAPAPKEEVPWGPALFDVDEDVPGGDTMQFPQPGALTPLPAGPAAGGGTMQFARPNTPAPSPQPRGGGGTMQFARPNTPAPSPQPRGGGTMQFAQPGQAPPASYDSPSAGGGTMQFAQPGRAAADDLWGDVLSPPPTSSAVFPIPAAPPPAMAPPPSEPKFAPNATSAWDQRSNPGIKLSEISSGPGSALDLVSADRPHLTPPPVKSKLDEVRTLLRGAKDLLGLDDHTGAMDLILKAQDLAPNDPEVQALRTRSEGTLEAMFESKLGKLTSAPRVKLKDDEIIWLNLDHRAGFVLAQIDGQCTFEDLFSVSGMSRLDTARILAQLIEEGVITR